ncbi:MAG: hypothetical protein NC356_02370 [Ruminococcus sp.]|nr:hypothetical protein [Ruminococcus sp.]
MSITAVTALFLLLLLFGCHLQLPAPVADKSEKHLTMADPEDMLDPLDEDMFIEPEIADLGEPDNMEAVEDALTPQGEPEQSETPNEQLVVNGPNSNDDPSPETLVATPKPNPKAQTTTPSQKDKPDQKIQSAEESVNVSFNNGKRTGKSSSAQSGKGSSESGQARGEAQGGRSLIKPYPGITGFTISNPITVHVTVQVTDKGLVVPGSANVIDLNKKYTDLRAKLKSASEKTHWTPKKGAPTVQGTITWTLLPGTK